MSDEKYQEETRPQARMGLPGPRFDLDVSYYFWPRSLAGRMFLVGAAVSVLMTPCNVVSLFLSDSLVGGSAFLIVVAFLLNLAAYWLPGAPVLLAFRNSAGGKQVVAVLVLTLAHVGGWLGWSCWVMMQWHDR